MHELLIPGEMARVDRAAVEAGVPARSLMENAGRAIVEAIEARYDKQDVLVACGPGNNGGDGFVAARLLAERGWPVTLALLGTRDALRDEAAAAAALWEDAVAPLEPELCARAGLVIDALFGAGLSRPVEGAVAAMVEAINAAQAEVVAVDMPSGVDGADGAVRGKAVAADLTVTFFRKKPGHLLFPGRGLCGDLVLADIGIPAAGLDAVDIAALQNDPALWALPLRPADGHKYQSGHCVVVSADWVQTGAARLAALAAARMGAGLVTLAGPVGALRVHANHVTAIMLAPAEGGDDLSDMLADSRKNAVVVGPGLPPNEHTREFVLAALDSDAALVLDAGALTAFADTPDTLFEAIAMRENHEVVLTPHHGELSRLFGALEGSKIDRANAAAVRSGATVLYKGSDSVIAHPQGDARVNTTGGPVLATAGTGDVLSGAIAGLLGQGMSAFDAASAAAHIHGLAGERFGAPGLIADDLPDLLAFALSDMQAR